MQQHVLGKTIDRKRDLLTNDCAGIEMQCSETAIDSGVVVLDAGGDAEEAGFQVADEVDELVAFDRTSRVFGQGPD